MAKTTNRLRATNQGVIFESPVHGADDRYDYFSDFLRAIADYIEENKLEDGQIDDLNIASETIASESESGVDVRWLATLYHEPLIP